ncbi:DUF6959 family protein [Streptacidiphilus jiangxiensis]|uniref:Uncharacterized protein n=1 Tax=Streptacidiphilus jiangxiensis TaxID=235985 RepID=A0A1H7NQ07_STRJI|nr:hypothetical protein [Streptacidiphilus jiangxiensis]SEL25108.1 hypothetical protein SAMN05414137_1075 [Streptacidiphilus jiangxiensis]
MERIEIELLAPTVIRMPGRRFPGVVVQGDSLSIIRSEVAEVTTLCAQGEVGEALESAQYLLAKLDEILGYYEDVLAGHGIDRPY